MSGTQINVSLNAEFKLYVSKKTDSKVNQVDVFTLFQIHLHSYVFLTFSITGKTLAGKGQDKNNSINDSTMLAKPASIS